MAEEPRERETDFERDPNSPGRIRELADRLDGSFQLEMLISGTVLFLAFTARNALAAQLAQPAGFTDFQAGVSVLLLLAFGNGLVVLVLGSLLVHLLLRSYWVGVVGIATVFPHGVRRDKIWGGPLLKLFSLRISGDLEKMATGLDRTCRLVYGLTFAFLATFCMALLFAGVLVVITLLLRSTVLPGATFLDVFIRVFGILYGPYLVLIAADYLRGRLNPQTATETKSLFARIALGYYQVMYWFTLQRFLGPVLGTVASNLPKQRYALLIVLYLALLYIGMFQPLVVSNLRPIRTEVSLPETQQAHHYLNLRTPENNAVLPVIDQDVYTTGDGYMKLFLPYRGRFKDSLSVWFPALRPIKETGLTIGRSQTDSSAVLPNLIALASCYQLTLDGKPLSLTYRLYSHPLIPADGLLAYVPLASLLPGPHSLLVRERASSVGIQYHIPFYVHP